MAGRKKEAAEKVQAKASVNSTSTSSSLSGPREPKKIKRRPVPSATDGDASSAVHPTVMERTQPAPRSAQPAPLRHGHAAPPVELPDNSRQHARHAPAAPAGDAYNAPVNNTTYAPRPATNYETPDDVLREWEAVGDPPHSQPMDPRRPQHEYYRPEPPVRTYEPQQVKTQHEPEIPSLIENRPKQTLQPNPPEPSPNALVTRPRSSHHSSAHASNFHAALNGHVSGYPSRPRGRSHPLPPETNYQYSHLEPTESSNHYRPQSNSLVKRNQPLLQYPPSHETYHPQYASMQPKVEDGEDELPEEEEAPPPPPPAHRTRNTQPAQRPPPAPYQLPPIYDAYGQEYYPSVPSARDVVVPPSGRSASPRQLDDLPPYTDAPSVPPSLVAGYDPTIAEAESDRVAYENQVSRKRSGYLTEPRPAPQHSLMGSTKSDRTLYDDQISGERSGHLTEQRPASHHSYMSQPPQPYDRQVVRQRSGTLTEQRPASNHSYMAPPPPSDGIAYDNQVSRQRGGTLTDKRPASHHSHMAPPPPSDRLAYEHQVVRKRSDPFIEQRPVSHHSMAQPPPSLSYDAPVYPLRTSNRQPDRKPITTRTSAGDIRTVPRRKSVSPHPPSSAEPRLSSVPYSPDSYNALNPNAGQDPAPPYEPSGKSTGTISRTVDTLGREVGPIIGDDGREIDPSDHLPTDTWAPEPEKKNRKPEVVVRFKHPSPVSNPQPRPSTGHESSSRAMVPSVNTGLRRPRSFVHFSNDPVEPVSRGRERSSYYPQYDTPASNTLARTHQRASVSPGGYSPSRGPYSPSSLYEPTNPGPPIPKKVPVAAPIRQGHPVTAVNRSMDALSKELKSIDIGCSSGRPARRFARPVETGYVI